jgi:hypothetical protein
MEHEHCERVIELSTRVENLEGWQKRQNGSLQKIEEKMDKIYMWLIGLMGGVITSLILLLINLGLGR